MGSEQSTANVPALENGDRLTLAGFERRYLVSPHIKRAELVEGVVHIASRGYYQHGRIRAQVVAWLGWYAIGSRDISFGYRPSLRLDAENEFQSDVCLWTTKSMVWQEPLNEEGDILVGVVEVATEEYATFIQSLSS